MRWLTAFAILLLCSFAAVRGWGIAQFAEERARLASRQDGTTGLERWIGVPGLTASALEASLARGLQSSDVDGPRKRLESLVALLAVRPLAPESWLSLAGMQLVTAQPYKQILAALLMSSVTGPDEGRVMWRRGTLGLLLWQALPPDGRRRAIRDLAGAIQGTSIGNEEMGETRIILGVKSPETRSQIADLLRTDGVTDIYLDHMGL